ncbi:Zinc finger, CCHC-type [Sesbania bispinosa]|nr:Zinc finger, CCHC-type [Sesbania bispinosa]
MENSEFLSSIKSYGKGRGEDSEMYEKDEKEDTGVGHEAVNRLLLLTADEIMCLEFGSEEEAYNFYQLYAKYHGFVVRKDDTTKDIRGNIIMRQFVCNKEGLRKKKHFMRVDRKREHRPLTRTNCLAKLRIHYHHKSLKWKVVSFEQCHNHELTPSRFVHLHPAYRRLTDADKSQVNSLHAYGLRGCHIMGYLVAQKGGYCRVGFTKKDMYNYLDRKNQAKVKKGDVRAALSYLQGKADSDPLLYGKYCTGSDGKLKRLFWADGVSRTYCKKKSSMVEFLHKFEQAKKEYRNNEMMAEFKTLFSKPVLTTYLRSIETEASKMLFESRGIPCSHIITAMKNEEMEHIPHSLICKRWLKNAKIDFMSHYDHEEMDSDVMEQACFAAISAACNNFAKGCTNGNPTIEHVGDPSKVKTKGAPKKKKDMKRRRRHCSNCSSTGHTIRRCPLRYGPNEKSKNDVELSNSKNNGDTEANDSEKDVMDTVEANGEQSNANEKKVEESNGQENNGQQTNVQFDCSRQNVKKAKEKLSGLRKQKGKTVREDSNPKHSEAAEIKPGGCSDGVNVGNGKVPPMMPNMVPAIHYPGYGMFSQGYPIHPHFSRPSIQNPNMGVPMYNQNYQFPVYQQQAQPSMYSHGAQFYPGMWNPPTNGTSMNDLLQQVMNNGVQRSEKEGEH